MGSFQAHLNEDLVYHLGLDSTDFPDWIITAIFYATVHYAEARFNKDKNILHSHRCRKSNEGLHDTRARLIWHYGLKAYISYRKLLNASYITRYLWDRAGGQDVGSYKYYNSQQVRDFYDIELTNVKRSLGFSHP
jgi:hypothetical protein